ncbi:MAG: hypothetical protein M3036_17205 [Bifidobacteriales bacterium]|nr:hypothetical protein [Bifidobacteriales bacterium]
MSEIIETARRHHTEMKALLDEYVPLVRELKKTNDQIVPSVQIYEVLRRLSDSVKDYRDAMKTAIVEDMRATGTIETEAGPYTVTLRKGATRAVVQDETALRAARPDLFEPQPDKINPRLLGQALRFGAVEGAALVEGDPTIAVKGNAK